LRLDQNIHIRPSTPRFLLRSSGSRLSYFSLAGAPFVARSAIPPLSCDTQNRPPVTCCLTPAHPSLTGYPFVVRLAFARLPTALLPETKSPHPSPPVFSLPPTYLPYQSNSLFFWLRKPPHHLRRSSTFFTTSIHFASDRVGLSRAIGWTKVSNLIICGEK